jgi:cyclophilin family peptidyl-prolyl cis-trans isomerase
LGSQSGPQASRLPRQQPTALSPASVITRRDLACGVAALSAALGAHALPALAEDAAPSAAPPDAEPAEQLYDPKIAPIPASDVCYLDFAIDGKAVGRVLIELYGSVAPRTVANFKELALGSKGFGYAGSGVFRVVEGFTVQMGDVVNNDGSSGKSIYGDSFEKENFRVRHSIPGMVSMINGRNGPDSRFLIDTRPDGSGYLDDKYVGFGRVVDGMDVIRRIERLPTKGTKNPPRSKVVITASGVVDAVA